MKLSIGMMVKNESKYLRQCLESLQPIREAMESELIIVDTGSIDNTVSIAKEFTDKVYFHQWNNNFSEMRNITVNYCSGEWFMFIDGDEIISDAKDLIDFFTSGRYKTFNTACVSIKSFNFSEKEDKFSVFLSPRLFKKDKDFCFQGSIHEQSNGKKPTIVLNLEIIHYGYMSNDKALMESKFIRNVDILKNQLKVTPEDIHYLYQLSVSYSVHGDLEQALEPIIKAAKIAKLQNEGLCKPMYVFSQLAYVCLVNKDYVKTEQICIEANGKDSIYLDMYFYLAKARFMMNKNKEAIESYKTYLEKTSNFNATYMSKDISIVHNTLGEYETAYIHLSTLYERQGDYEIALGFAKKVKTEKNIKEGITLVVSLYIKLSDYLGLENYYNEMMVENIKYKEYFIMKLEENLLGLTKSKKENIYKIFTKGHSEYALLNSVRLNIEKLQKDIITGIYAIDFNKLPDYFGDFIYYMVFYKISISEILNKTNDYKIKSLFLYILNSHKDFSVIIYQYLMDNNIKEHVFDVIRENKILAFYSLSSQAIEEEQYKEVFNMYLKYGWSYLEKVYNINVIEKELVNCMKDEEDLFLMYMLIARNNKSNQTIYIKNLRKALNASNYMKRGIEILLEEIKEEIVPQNNEMKLYMEKVKESISELINTNNTKDAIILIEEYESIIKEDFEIYSMKAVISIMENRLEDAEDILISALEKFDDNFDLTYNLAYVYQQVDNKQKALYFYKKAVELGPEPSIFEEIKTRIQDLQR